MLHPLTKKLLAAFFLPILLDACAQRSFLERIEHDSGVTYQRTGKIIIRGTEADYGPGQDIEITEAFLIQQFWDSIHLARPYDVWYASGYRIVEFYGDPEAEPSLILYVNESSATHTNHSQQRYRCPGLHELIARLQADAFGD